MHVLYLQSWLIIQLISTVFWKIKCIHYVFNFVLHIVQIKMIKYMINKLCLHEHENDIIVVLYYMLKISCTLLPLYYNKSCTRYSSKTSHSLVLCWHMFQRHFQSNQQQYLYHNSFFFQVLTYLIVYGWQYFIKVHVYMSDIT